MSLDQFPAMNATLNSLSVIFLLAGFAAVRGKKINLHKALMLSATFTSTLFLVSYLYYHYHHGSTRYQGQGMWRTIYFTILITHSVLAVVQVPLILRTLYLAIRGQFDKHRFWARITFPIWLYVSITGVVIYWMLYR